VLLGQTATTNSINCMPGVAYQQVGNTRHTVNTVSVWFR